MINMYTALTGFGLSAKESNAIIQQLDTITKHQQSQADRWAAVVSDILTKNHYSFAIHRLLFTYIYPDWPHKLQSAVAWQPDKTTSLSANITNLMQSCQLNDVPSLHTWTTTYYEDFWAYTVKQLNIQFKQTADKIVDLTQGVESPHWFPHAKMNIVDSCFNAPSSATAIVYQNDEHQLCHMTYESLRQRTNYIANELVKKGYKPGDAIAIVMPMHAEAICLYLGIIKMGGIVVGIAESFSDKEIAVRLKISHAKAVYTQPVLKWAGKTLPLYEKVKSAIQIADLACEVVNVKDKISGILDTFDSHYCDPMTTNNILFSSGTTAEPKAISWNHTTPIKAASDAFYHQNIQPNDVLVWPTSLGWMMGPWLIYASFINKATLALYPDAPKDKAFGEFVQNAKVTMLGVVPTLVSTWRQSACMEGLDWSNIKLFTSTGECSNPEDMLYLMSLVNYKPVVEYCGGTEIGGAYITSTVLQNNSPSLFTTPTLGLNFILLNEEGQPSDEGEVAIIPPSIGLSVSLLNNNHYQVYFDGMPALKSNAVLRRHGDQLQRFDDGTYCILGRVDDAMNLGGIKISATEIERELATIEGIAEVAAIAITPLHHGPNQLVIYAVTTTTQDKQRLLQQMQHRISTYLNPLFKITDLIFVDELPKTASNKVMRRLLRKSYEKTS